jgi:type III restriction enzyme
MYGIVDCDNCYVSCERVFDYRDTEKIKIECARRHFATISDSSITYDVVKSYDELRAIITS